VHRAESINMDEEIVGRGVNVAGNGNTPRAPERRVTREA
jgi:hypothetical protein